MSILSLMEAKLPPGFRFYPKDEELICHYLANKVAESGRNSSDAHVMVEVDLNKIEPWDLPETARVGGKEWYFYSLRDRKYATGIRRNRATASGYWKATGKDRQVADSSKGTVVGMRKTLVFYHGRAPKGKKTDWVMHEFRLEGPSNPAGITFKEDWVLCRVFNKNRGVPSKLWQDNSFDDAEPPPSLPPLADNFLILDQTPPNLEGSVQMHCLPNFTKSSTDPSLKHVFQLEPIMPTRDLSNLEPFLGLGNFFNPICCEKRTMGVVLDHLKLEGDQKMEIGPRSRGGSLDNYLSEMGLSHMWNHY